MVQENYKSKYANLLVRCGMLENRLDWLNRIMRDEYPENQTRVMRLIIKTRKKLLIIDRLLSHGT